MQLEANTSGSGYDTSLSVYTGVRGALDQFACNDDAGDSQQSRVRFAATAGTTYYFMAGTTFSAVQLANLVFNLMPGPPPFLFTPTVAQFGSVTSSTGACDIQWFHAVLTAIDCHDLWTAETEARQCDGDWLLVCLFTLRRCHTVERACAVPDRAISRSLGPALLGRQGRAHRNSRRLRCGHGWSPRQMNLVSVITLRGKK